MVGPEAPSRPIFLKKGVVVSGTRYVTGRGRDKVARPSTRVPAPERIPRVPCVPASGDEPWNPTRAMSHCETMALDAPGTPR